VHLLLALKCQRRGTRDNIPPSWVAGREVRLFRILVVEDFERFRRAVCALLQQTGRFQVTEVSNGTKAIQEFEELKPDLILLDIGLPGLNGLDVARKLDAASKTLFLSQESSSDVVREALGLGAGYVHKLDMKSELLTAIEAVFEGKRYVSSSLEGSESAELQNSAKF
jgi:DNA-binding NarL/FixJ family response regulator